VNFLVSLSYFQTHVYPSNEVAIRYRIWGIGEGEKVTVLIGFLPRAFAPVGRTAIGADVLMSQTRTMPSSEAEASMVLSVLRSI
jgi:hypothetical protein